jgi:hypothetical protein
MLLMNLTDMFDRAMAEVAKADFSMSEVRCRAFVACSVRALWTAGSATAECGLRAACPAL